MGALTVRVIGASEMKQRLSHLRTKLPRAYSKNVIGGFMVERLQARFRQAEAPDGQKWRALSPKTKRGIGILRKTQSLMRSIAVIGGTPPGIALSTGVGFRIGVKSAPRQVIRKDGSSFTVDPAKYGRFHQQGLGVPPRVFLGWNKSDEIAIVAKIKRELKYLAG